MKKTIKSISLLLVCSAFTFFSCQKMDHPSLASNYPKDANQPGGPLKFYAAFDGTSSNVLLNAVDSIRASFPATNPMTVIDGISGKAIQGDGTNYITYASPNDFGSTASSFTISFWEKRDGIPNGNASFVFTIPSSNGKWGSYGFSMFLLFDWGSWTPATDATVKFYMVDDVAGNDNWLTWEGGNKVPGIQDNQWHHLAFVYDATASTLTLYVDGVANSNVPSWGGHGGIGIDASKIQGLNVGGNKNIHDMGWGMNWDAGLDQFRMYATALSATEVKALFDGKK
ncbi:MAG TPA: hypothetical protein DGG95_03295 [Cytophagales bacterium]|jgi:hypothetical protein|nr:hypothetical protein [Cytophagales bacterium]